MAAPVQLAYHNSNRGANSQGAIASFIKGSNLFGPSSSTPLTFGGAVDDTIHGLAVIAAQDHPHDYLAVHLGRFA